MMFGLVRALDGDDEEDDNGESEPIELTNTPADTTFEDLNLTSFREAFSKFEEAYLYIANNYTDKDMYSLTEEAIQGLFNELDHHTVYIMREDSRRIQEYLDGRLTGMGHTQHV